MQKLLATSLVLVSLSSMAQETTTNAGVPSVQSNQTSESPDHGKAHSQDHHDKKIKKNKHRKHSASGGVQRPREKH